MQRHTRFFGFIMFASAGLLLAGCPFQDERTSNQGGGSVITAVSKITGGRMTGLTADEIQILGDTVSDLSPEIDININDEQAAAVTDFLEANNLDSINEVEDFVHQAEDDPSSVVIPQSLIDLIESGIDLSSIVEVQGAA